MADPRQRLDGNAPGEFYVDSSCIDCDQCRQIAPATFRAEAGISVVSRQPESAGELLAAEKALVTCPTASIGTVTKRDLDAAIAAYPERIDGDVHFCGFSSASSYGASSYLIVRPGGNVLVDSPRFAAPLVKRLEALGGVRTMVLTHRDDVADHAKFREHFRCDRVIHEKDAEFSAERVVRGLEPVDLGEGLLVIPAPGHTPGHQVLLYRERYLFTGDHLAWDPGEGRLDALEDYCWHSWEEQRRSMERLLRWPFEWILPGHGARHHAPAADLRGLLAELLTRMA